MQDDATLIITRRRNSGDQILAAIFYASPHLHQLDALHKTNPDDLINALNGQITETIDEAYHEFCQQLTGPQSLDEEQLIAPSGSFATDAILALLLLN